MGNRPYTAVCITGFLCLVYRGAQRAPDPASVG
jgi:hypothetical protein